MLGLLGDSKGPLKACGSREKVRPVSRAVVCLPSNAPVHAHCRGNVGVTWVVVSPGHLGRRFSLSDFSGQ